MRLIGKRLRVSDIVAGGYLLENDNLHVTMELVDVARGATVWRTELVVSPQRLIVLGNRLAGRMTQGLLPTMNIRDASVSEMPVATSERAFDLYLHSIAASHDPEGFYRYASVLSFCGQADAALDQLRNAIQGNYCSYPAMEKDPLFAPIRQQPEFKELE